MHRHICITKAAEVRPIPSEAGHQVLKGDEDDTGRGRIGHAGLAARALPLGRYPGGGRTG